MIQMKVSLKIKIMTVVVGLIIAANLSLGSFAHNIADSAITKTVNSLMSHVTDNVAQKIEAKNIELTTAAKSMAALPQMTDDSLTDIDKTRILNKVAHDNSDIFMDLAYYNTNGITYIGGNPNLATSIDKEPYFPSLKTGKCHIVDPFYDDHTKMTIMFYLVPIMENGRFRGAVSALVKGDFLEKIAESIDIGDGTHPVIFSMDTGAIIGKSNSGTNGRETSLENLDPNSDLAKTIKRVISGETGSTYFDDLSIKRKMIASFRPVGNSCRWAVFCAAPYDFYFADMEKLNTALVIILVITIVIASAIALVIIQKLIEPLLHVKKSITDIATGNADLTKRIEQKTYDEIGDVVAGFNTFTDKLQGIMTGLKKSKDTLSIAGEDLDASTQDTSTSISEILENIKSIHSQIITQSNSVSQTAGAVNQIASNIESLEHMIENQTAGVSQASAAVEEMIGNITSVNKSVDKMSVSFSQLFDSTTQGSQLQVDVNEKIDTIRNQSETLLEANEAIAAIAEQTNLLAMNAAIEAAHAGEAGKGFSVVADEIRKLSETSGEQSRTISEHLTSIRASIEEVVKASNLSSDAFGSITSKVNETDELVRQIKSAMEEQTEGSQQISSVLHTMNDSTLEVRTASKEMSEGNKAILEEIRNLQDATGAMESSMDGMSAGARKIDETGVALTEISRKMRESISQIGNEIDQFKI